MQQNNLLNLSDESLTPSLITTIKQLGDYEKIIQSASSQHPKPINQNKPKQKRGTANTQKSSSNISRVRRRIEEISLCNKWDFAFTLTIDQKKYNRYELSKFIKSFRRFLSNLNSSHRKKELPKITYLFVLEQHKDGAWHLHGLISGLIKEELYQKEDSLGWEKYEKKFGVSCLKEISDIHGWSIYLTKDLRHTAKNLDLETHSYYASKNLSRATTTFRGKAQYKKEIDWDYANEYCKLKLLPNAKSSAHDYIEYTE